MTDRDRLIELVANADIHDSYECRLCTRKDISCVRCDAEKFADYLLANGVRVIDTKFINPENRELITHFAGMPINDVLDLVRAKKEGKLIVPPCKVGDIVYVKVFDEIKSFVVASIELKYTAKNLENTCISYNGEYPMIFEFENIGKTVFLTKEEAEEKLKECAE